MTTAALKLNEEKFLKAVRKRLTEAEEGETSSDEEYQNNTIGEEIPLEWYKSEFDHIGYNRGGKQIVPKGEEGLDAVHKALLSRGDSKEAKEYRRSVYDERNDETTRLTDRELTMVKRIVEGKYAQPEFNAEEDYVDWFSGVPSVLPLNNQGDEPKRRFIPSKWERMKIERIARGIAEGRIKVESEQEAAARRRKQNEKKLYMLWGDDGAVENQEEILRRRRRTHGGYIPAPKMRLPGHAESYHPSPEYLWTEAEVKAWEEERRREREEEEEEDKKDGEEEEEEEGEDDETKDTTRKLKDQEDEDAVAMNRRAGLRGPPPKDFAMIRRVPAYSDFIKERFERCLDLYLCPRTTKVRLNIDPESLVPRLPLPKELRPFPTTEAVSYLGHTARVCTVAVDARGELVGCCFWSREGGRETD